METYVMMTTTHMAPFAGFQHIMDPKERFYRHFQEELTTIQELLKQLSSIAVAGGERHDATENILTGISRLSDEVSDASDYIPAYDQRTYAQAIKALTEQLNETTAQHAPRGRFKFKPKVHPVPQSSLATLQDTRGMPQPGLFKQGSAVVEGEGETDAVGDLPSFGSKDYNAEVKRQGGTGVRKPSFSAARDISLSDHEDVHIILPATAARAATSGNLTNIHRSIVDMSAPTSGAGSFAGLGLKNITSSLVIAGQVSGPAHITGLRDSIVVVAAHQVRIHECANVDIYLHCTSRPIIEDCSGMRFAPIPNCYMTQNQEAEKNQWDQVDDFKWLKTEHSPNWSILPEDKRLGEEVWTKRVPGGPGVGVKDILKDMGILPQR